MDNDALYLIAEELRKMRVLKEYELGVIVQTDGEDPPSMRVFAGIQHRVNGTPSHGGANKEDFLWHEHVGKIRTTERG